MDMQMLAAKIWSLRDQPKELEALYREQKSAFKWAIQQGMSEYEAHPIISCWQERFADYRKEGFSWGPSRQLLWMLLACLLAGIAMKLPDLLQWDNDYYFSRNVAFIFLPMLAFFFGRTHHFSQRSSWLMVGFIIANLIYMNLLPNDKQSDSILLASMHQPLLMWALFGICYVGDWRNLTERRIQFLQFNGDWIVFTGLVALAGGLLSAVTIGLFELLGIRIEDFYFRYIVLFLLPSAPLAAAYLLYANPQMAGKITTVLAKIFTPLVLVMLTTYLVAMGFAGKDPYNDRSFLLLFNALLIGVLAIIFFSVSGYMNEAPHRAEVILLFALALLTLLVNAIALSAIVFRLWQWGITPNRLAVLGSNLLFFVHLIKIMLSLGGMMRSKQGMLQVHSVITSFLPVYAIWTVVVVWLFPLLFGFK